MRLIDADALKASIPETETDIFENCQICTTLMDYEVKDLINAQPTIPAPRWHRVEDELPEPHEYVLCCGKKSGCFVGWTLDNSDVVKANGHGRAFVHGGNARTFTHWMPLPEPPKEDA